MKKPSDRREQMREKLIGLGERSFRKSYYPELQGRLDQLERFRALLDHTRDIILLARLPASRIVDANASACRQLGYSGAELAEMEIEEVLDMGNLQWPEAGCLEDEGMLVSAMRRRDGGILPVEFSLCVDRFATSSYLVVVARDITERLRAEAGLKQALAAAERARDKIDAILRSVADGLIVTDLEDRVVLLNRSVEALLGVAQESAAGLLLWDLLRNRLRMAGEEELKPVGPEAAFSLERQEEDPQHPRIYQGRRTFIRDRTGRPTGIITILQDITREREIDRMKTEFISTAAHEFRTPLTSIQGFSELLLRLELPEADRHEFLTYIHEKSFALSRIVDDLLDIARIEAGQGLTLNIAAWTVGDLLGQAAPLIQANLPSYRFEIAAAEEKTPLLADRDKIGQVLENLVSNAIKYSAAGTLIRIAGEPEGELYRVSVIDRGIGMTPPQLERVFDKFYRADASNRSVGGVGLGMSIARSIVEAHGGRIWVESAPGAGTSVHFTLPVAPPGALPASP